MDEFPITTIPDVPHWSENFAVAGFDPHSGVHIFFHMGRWRKDRSQWREIIGIYLPDGTVVAHRGIGNARATATGPGGGNFAIDSPVPGKHMTYRFLGGARRFPAAQMLDGLVQEGPKVRLAFDLDFTSDYPVWDLHKSGHKTDFVGQGHDEQIGRLTGTIEVGEDRYRFDSLVNRDHSRGPRVFDTNGRHIWAQGYFDNGLAFQCYEAELVGRDGIAFSEVAVYEGLTRFDGRMELGFRIPFEDNLDAFEGPVPLVLHYDGKRIAVTALRFPTATIYQATSPNDLYVGRRQVDKRQNCFVYEQGVHFVTDEGVAGYGHFERLAPGQWLADPL